MLHMDVRREHQDAGVGPFGADLTRGFKPLGGIGRRQPRPAMASSWDCRSQSHQVCLLLGPSCKYLSTRDTAKVSIALIAGGRHAPMKLVGSASQRAKE